MQAFKQFLSLVVMTEPEKSLTQSVKQVLTV